MTKIVAISCTLISSIAFIAAYSMLYMRIEDLYSRVIVLDTSGKIYESISAPESYMRIYEYEDHVKTFVKKWYEFDEKNYEQNIAIGLELIGNRGKQLLSDYNDINMLNSLIQKNLSYTVKINEIKVDMNTIPVSGYIVFTQTGRRAHGTISRDIKAMFTLYDISRSRENSHGVKIEDWQVEFIRKSTPEESVNY